MRYMRNLGGVTGWRDESDSHPARPSDDEPFDLPEPLEPDALVTPAMPEPGWFREFDDRAPRTHGRAPAEDDDHRFGDEPPTL